MTPEELHTQIEVVAYHHPDGALQAAILELVRAAVAEERKTCAQVARDFARWTERGISDGEAIAAAILARP